MAQRPSSRKLTRNASRPARPSVKREPVKRDPGKGQETSLAPAAEAALASDADVAQKPPQGRRRGLGALGKTAFSRSAPDLDLLFSRAPAPQPRAASIQPPPLASELPQEAVAFLRGELLSILKLCDGT